jgi:hypothetical protein
MQAEAGTSNFFTVGVIEQNFDNIDARDARDGLLTRNELQETHNDSSSGQALRLAADTVANTSLFDTLDQETSGSRDGKIGLSDLRKFRGEL